MARVLYDCRKMPPRGVTGCTFTISQRIGGQGGRPTTAVHSNQFGERLLTNRHPNVHARNPQHRLPFGMMLCRVTFRWCEHAN